jgi:16S rRNA (uracil1498-N3)-methyltransferase
MHLFYSTDLKNNTTTLTLSEEESHHFNVLRIADDEEVSVTNGKGLLCKARMLHKTKREVLLSVFDCQQQQLSRRICLAVAPTKGNDRFDWLLEKATEVGVTDILPVYTHYTERKKINTQRIEKRLIASTKQSMRAFVPQVADLQKLEVFFRTLLPNVQKLIAHCKQEGLPLLSEIVEPQQDVLALIGPEGGFSDEEILLAKQYGFDEVSLSENRLRTETAAITAVMMMKTGGQCK